MNEALVEFKQNVLGPLSVGYYLSAFFFSMLGLSLSLWRRSKDRNPDSPRTPEKFSWRFLIWDNLKKIYAGLVTMYLLFRFASEWLDQPLGMALSVGIGFVISLALPAIIDALMKRYDWICKVLEQPREKYMQKLEGKDPATS